MARRLKESSAHKLSEERELRLAISNIAKGDFGEVSKHQMSAFKSLLVNGPPKDYSEMQGQLASKIRKKHKEILHFLKHLNQEKSEVKGVPLQNILISEEEESLGEKKESKIQLICAIQLSKLKEILKESKRKKRKKPELSMKRVRVSESEKV